MSAAAGDAFARSRSPDVASTGASARCRAEVCLSTMRCFRTKPASARRQARTSVGATHCTQRCRAGATTVASCQRRSVRASSAPRLFRDTGSATRTPEPVTIDEGAMPLASTAADRTSRVNDGTALSRAGTEYKFPVRWRQVVEPALYTVEGRQTGDLPQKCGSALIRKAKLPARSCGRSSLFLQGWLTKRIERVRAAREVGHASHRRWRRRKSCGTAHANQKTRQPSL